ncbi:MAG: hypothetical protein K0R83_34 [Caulobacter sp.]|nr:hypothetical protein [Caulobacter sp.]
MNRLLLTACLTSLACAGAASAQAADTPLFAGTLDVPVLEGSVRLEQCGMQMGDLGPGSFVECIEIDRPKVRAVMAAYDQGLVAQGWTAVKHGGAERRTGKTCDRVSHIELPGGPKADKAIVFVTYQPSTTCLSRKP